MSVTVRPAQENDLEAILELEALAFDTDRLSRRGWRAQLRQSPARAVVALCANTLVGAGMILLRSDSSDARLYSLATDPNWRGRGVGRLLLSALEDLARAAGRTGIRLEVKEFNASALALYKRAGYEQIGRIDGYYTDGTNALRLRRTLIRQGEVE